MLRDHRDKAYVVVAMRINGCSRWLTDKYREARYANGRWGDAIVGPANDPATWERVGKALAEFRKGGEERMAWIEPDLSRFSPARKIPAP
jgi:hypothetical protein